MIFIPSKVFGFDPILVDETGNLLGYFVGPSCIVS